MCKILVVFAAVAFTGLTYSQDASSFSKFKLAVYGAPEYSNLLRTNKQGSNIPQSSVDNINQRTSGNFGFTAGVSAIYALNKKFELAAGLAFGQWGIKYDDQANWPDAPNYRFTSYDYYFEVPIKASVLAGNKKVKFITTGEAAFTLQTFYRLKYDKETAAFYNNLTNNELEFHKTPFPGIRLGVSAGIDYQFASSFSLRIEPQFKYLWFNNKNSSVHPSVFIFGLNCTLVKSF